MIRTIVPLPTYKRERPRLSPFLIVTAAIRRGGKKNLWDQGEYIFPVGRDSSAYSYPEVICRMSVNNSSERRRGEGVTFFIASQEVGGGRLQKLLGSAGDIYFWISEKEL